MVDTSFQFNNKQRDTLKNQKLPLHLMVMDQQTLSYGPNSNLWFKVVDQKFGISNKVVLGLPDLKVVYPHLLVNLSDLNVC